MFEVVIFVRPLLVQLAKPLLFGNTWEKYFCLHKRTEHMFIGIFTGIVIYFSDVLVDGHDHDFCNSFETCLGI